MVGGWSVVIDQGRAIGFFGCAMAPDSELLGSKTTTQVAKQRRTQHDQRKGHIKCKYCRERRRRYGPQPIVLQCARADSMRRLYHDGRYSGLDAIEESGHHRDFADRK